MREREVKMKEQGVKAKEVGKGEFSEIIQIVGAEYCPSAVRVWLTMFVCLGLQASHKYHGIISDETKCREKRKCCILCNPQPIPSRCPVCPKHVVYKSQP